MTSRYGLSILIGLGCQRDSNSGELLPFIESLVGPSLFPLGDWEKGLDYTALDGITHGFSLLIPRGRENRYGTAPSFGRTAGSECESSKINCRKQAFPPTTEFHEALSADYFAGVIVMFRKATRPVSLP